MSGVPSDDDLLALLGAGLREAEPVAPHTVDAARGAHTWHAVDAELAQLTYDSLNDRELAGVRSTDEESREMTFTAPGVEIEIMVHESSRELIGQLVPPRETTVSLTAGNSIFEATTDSLGRFRFADLAAGPLRLAVIDDDPTRTVQTEWIVI